MKKQVLYTEDILFDNYMVSAYGEEFVHSQIPFYIESEIYEKAKYYAEEVNKLSLRVLENINETHKKLFKYFDDFPYRKEIFNLKCPLSPMYWTRYDTFIDKSDDVYFSEFNYDKPCGQKEINLAEKSSFKGNLNKGFTKKLKEYLIEISDCFIGKNGRQDKINIGFLMDPCHYEELHHAYYFKKLLKDTKINIIPVGNNNLSVKEEYVYAFAKEKIDIILRLFPTEFDYEVRNIKEILDVFNKGNVLILNDPRIIAIQAKGFFAYLWDLVNKDSDKLTFHEKDIIKKCLPYTAILNEGNIKSVIENKDKYVVKSSLGRYSEEVYIGKMYTGEEWENKIKKVLESKKIHIVQDCIDVRQEYTYAPDYNNTNYPMLAYGNFGIYIMNKSVTGILVRWNERILTDDNYTWMCPLGKDDYPIKIEKTELTNNERIKLYSDLDEELSFKSDFTGSYTNFNEYLSLDKLTIDRELYDEIKYASKKFCSVLEKVYPTIRDNLNIFGQLLGIPESLYEVISRSSVKELCAVGRIDFALDNSKNLKILEFNSETPAGLVEAMDMSSILKKKLDIKYDNPNENMRDDLKSTLKQIIKEIQRKKQVKNIAVVTSWYYEDIYNTKIISDILKECGDFNVIFGNIYDMKIENNKIYLYGKEIHAIYRYYPLDWFYKNQEMQKFIKILSSEEYLINPAHTLITQSKVFFAVLYELLDKGILDCEEEKFIKKYIPYTSLEINDNLSKDYFIKPYLEREGDGISDNYMDMDEKKEYIFQDRVNIRPLRMNVYSTIGKKEKFQFPILGAYITGSKMAGIYTRMGEIVTDVSAKYISTFIK